MICLIDYTFLILFYNFLKCDILILRRLIIVLIFKICMYEPIIITDRNVTHIKINKYLKTLLLLCNSR